MIVPMSIICGSVLLLSIISMLAIVAIMLYQRMERGGRGVHAFVAVSLSLLALLFAFCHGEWCPLLLNCLSLKGDRSKRDRANGAARFQKPCMTLAGECCHAYSIFVACTVTGPGCSNFNLSSGVLYCFSYFSMSISNLLLYGARRPGNFIHFVCLLFSRPMDRQSRVTVMAISTLSAPQ